MVATAKLKPCAFAVRNFVITNYLWESWSIELDTEGEENPFHLTDSNYTGTICCDLMLIKSRHQSY